MSVAVVTGSSGLIGAETARFLHEQGLTIVGIDNNMRKYFFGEDGSVEWNTRRLQDSLKRFEHNDIDIRDASSINRIFAKYAGDIKLVVHAAAQPSHDWAAREPITDFTVNANGTLNLLEATRFHCPQAVFIFTSTNKVYGDNPNRLPLVEHEKRWELDPAHPFARHGIDETMSVDQCKHSFLGSSKLSADVMVQEYGRYFGIRTGSFRGGCLTGPAHSAAELHGFLAYLVKCVIHGRPYRILGHKGKQVRDNIHSFDLVNAFWHFFQNPKAGAVYNIGGSRHSNCSMIEAIELAEKHAGRKLACSYSDEARSGDHVWWVSDVRKFQRDYPAWKFRYGIDEIIRDIAGALREPR